MRYRLSLYFSLFFLTFSHFLRRFLVRGDIRAGFWGRRLANNDYFQVNLSPNFFGRPLPREPSRNLQNAYTGMPRPRRGHEQWPGTPERTRAERVSPSTATASMRRHLDNRTTAKRCGDAHIAKLRRALRARPRPTPDPRALLARKALPNRRSFTYRRGTEVIVWTTAQSCTVCTVTHVHTTNAAGYDRYGEEHFLVVARPGGHLRAVPASWCSPKQ